MLNRIRKQQQKSLHSKNIVILILLEQDVILIINLTITSPYSSTTNHEKHSHNKNNVSPHITAGIFDGEAAGDDRIIALLPYLFGLAQPLPGFFAIRLVQRERSFALGRNDIVTLHEEHVDVGSADLGAVTVAGERVLDSRAARVDAAEVAVELHVVLLGVYNGAIRFIVTQHRLAYVRAVAELALEHARQSAALRAVVAVVALHSGEVHLLRVR